MDSQDRKILIMEFDQRKQKKSAKSKISNA